MRWIDSLKEATGRRPQLGRAAEDRSCGWHSLTHGAPGGRAPSVYVTHTELPLTDVKQYQPPHIEHLHDAWSPLLFALPWEEGDVISTWRGGH